MLGCTAGFLRVFFGGGSFGSSSRIVSGIGAASFAAAAALAFFERVNIKPSNSSS